MLNYTTGLEVFIRVWVNHKRSFITCFNLSCQPSLRSSEWIKFNWVDCYHYIFDLFWTRFKKNHSYYIKDYDFITIQTQNMQGIDFSFSSSWELKFSGWHYCSVVKTVPKTDMAMRPLKWHNSVHSKSEGRFFLMSFIVPLSPNVFIVFFLHLFF